MTKTRTSVSIFLIKIFYFIVSALVFITKGEKRLVNLKVSLGIAILSFNSVILFSQQNDSLKVNVKGIKVDTINVGGATCYVAVLEPTYLNNFPESYEEFDKKTGKFYSSNIETFIKKNIEYPQKALKKGIEGIVEVQFNIDSLYNLRNIKIISSLGYGCDKEAIRIVKSIPKEMFSGTKLKPEMTAIISVKFNKEENNINK